MTEIAHHIDLNLVQKLRSREYRQKFFLAESSAHIAEQLIALRKRRGLDQTQLAEMIGTQQPAISRVEKAEYHNWSFNTLRKIADAQDARIRVSIQPAEDILKEYETEAGEQPIEEFVTVILNQMAAEQSAHQSLYISPYTWQTFPDTTLELRYKLVEKDKEIARLNTEHANLKTVIANLKMARYTRPESQDPKWSEKSEGIDPQLLTVGLGGQPLHGRAQ